MEALCTGERMSRIPPSGICLPASSAALASLVSFCISRMAASSVRGRSAFALSLPSWQQTQFSSMSRTLLYSSTRSERSSTYTPPPFTKTRPAHTRRAPRRQAHLNRLPGSGRTLTQQGQPARLPPHPRPLGTWPPPAPLRLWRWRSATPHSRGLSPRCPPATALSTCRT